MFSIYLVETDVARCSLIEKNYNLLKTTLKPCHNVPQFNAN